MPLARVANHCHYYQLVPGSGPVVHARPGLDVDVGADLSSHGAAPLAEVGVGLVLNACWLLVAARIPKQNSRASPEEEWGQELPEVGSQLWVVE